jgi:predicted oxidoreductase
LITEENYKTDVVIAGGGIAGIVAALNLLESDKKVLMLDRDEQDNFGGLAKLSFGAMFFVNSPQQRWTGIKDNVDLALKDWVENANFSEADHWPRKWAEFYVNNCTELGYKWLRKQGVKFLPVVNWAERRSDDNPGNTVPRFHVVWGSGQGLTQALIDKLLSHRNIANLNILFRHKVTDIEQQAGRVTGLCGINEYNNREFSVDADNTVIASGGICGSIERIRENWYQPWGEPPEIILNGSHRYADGLLHDAAVNAGAVLTHLDKQWLYAGGIKHPKPTQPGHGLSIISSKTSLWLGSQGQRFGPEPLVGGFDTRRIVESICQQEHKYSWQILNMKIAIKEFAISGSEYNRALRDKKLLRFLRGIFFGVKGLVDEMLESCDDFLIANSIDEMIDKMQDYSEGVTLDRDAIKAGIKQYDDAADPNGPFDKQRELVREIYKYPLDRLRTCNNQKIDDASAYPLIAIKQHILTRKTLGGIQTDLGSRVLSQSGEPIPGLYAVGEAAGYGGGGIHGLRSLEGTFLGGCVMSGRLAAADILDIKL